jgi:SH3 domain-containing YSC84-like protein 1
MEMFNGFCFEPRYQRKEDAMRKLIVFACLAGMGVPAFCASDTEKLDARVDAARTVIQEIMSTPDKAIPDSITKKAVCIGVIPGVKKGAFIIGAEYGQGVVTCRTGHGWSGPVFIRLGGGSFGLQAGGQDTDLVLVAVNDKGFQDLLHSKFKIGGDASAAAGPVGRDTQASTDISLRAELLTWSRTKGLFAGIDLNGATISQNTDDTTKLYGSEHTFDQILHGGVPPPASSRPFLQTVSRFFRSARAQ